jgi:cobalt-precorrin 5A hydrolase/precorrin-3B C17-methyltransferase
MRDVVAAPTRAEVVTVSVTEPGRVLARRLPFRSFHGDPAAVFRNLWAEVDAFVSVLAVGATVRLIAPLLSDKATDPAVVCVDDAGHFAVALCGGHQGGANALARRVAELVGGTAVITTATDNLGVPALDQLPGLVATGDIASVTAAMVAGESIEVDSPQGWPVPAVLAGRRSAPASSPPRVTITDRRRHDADVALRPPSLVVGVGTSTGATAGEVIKAVGTALDQAGLAPESMNRIATVDRRAEHPALTGLADHFGLPVLAFAAEVLDQVAVPNPSDAVHQAVGTHSVAEAAALAAAGPGAELVVQKVATATATVAVARRPHPTGSVTVVGLGPGGAWHRTPAAELAIRRADVVVGYSAYVDQCRDLLVPSQTVRAFPLGAELERAGFALAEAAGGARVALVCSGDAGVYAMASPLLELAGTPRPDGVGPLPDIEIHVVAGVSAALAAGAVLGAPLGHDHAAISLSDLHTPWEHIARRLDAAAAADFVVVLYNPRSTRRTWQLPTARDIFLRHRHGSTPVGVVTDAARPGEQSLITTLVDLPCEDVTMTSCVVVGSSTTRILGGRMVTPRGYPE